MHNNNTYAQQQYICTTTIHIHNNNTYAQQYICTTTINMHNNNTYSQQQYICTTIHMHNNNKYAQQQYIFTTTIHMHNNTYTQQYICTTTIHMHNNNTYALSVHIITHLIINLLEEQHEHFSLPPIPTHIHTHNRYTAKQTNNKLTRKPQQYIYITTLNINKDCHGRDLMVHELSVGIPLRRGVLDTTLCDKVCQ